MCKVDKKARDYADTESMHRKKIVGEPFTDYERDVAITSYKRGYFDAIRLAETAAIYSGKGIIEAIRELRR